MNVSSKNAVRHLGAGRIEYLQIPDRLASPAISVRQADVDLLANAPAGFLDTTHFDTVRFPPPPWATATFAGAADDGALAYTGYRGHGGVLASVAEALGAFSGLQIDPTQNLILTPGTQGGLFSAYSALIEQGDRIVLLDPEYLFAERVARFLGADVGHVRLITGEGDPAIDFENLEAEFAEKGARFFAFSNPHNPTGAVFSTATIGRIAELAKKYDVTMLVDELYSRLVYGDTPFTHLANLPGMFERTVTLFGPSKTESLSGYRLGIVVAPARIISRIENVLSITALRAPAYAQHVLVPWLRDDHEWLAERMKSFQSLRELTIRQFRRLPWLKLHPQQGTAYLWPDVSALNLPGPAVATALMTDASVLVSPGYQFGPDSIGHFRVCYARDEELWEQALERIVDVLDRLAGRHGLGGKTSW